MNNVIAHRHRAAGRGFTLIELMVVMGIISLLVAIALPAFSAARKNAKKVTSEATVAVLGTGLEQFNADTTVGGQYPPSLKVEPASPYLTNPGLRVNSPAFTGANALVWALAGADLLGTPGFRDLDGQTDPYGGWLSDTSRGYQGGGGSGNPCLYTIGTDGRPMVSRSGPYVDMSKIKLAKQLTVGYSGGYSGTGPGFQIPSSPSTILQAQVFLDSFDQPILYYRANTGAPGMVASGGQYIDFLGNLNSAGSPDTYALTTSNGIQRYAPTGIYNLLDNALFTGNGSNEAGWNFGAGSNHPMGTLGQVSSFTPPAQATWQKTGTFGQHLWNAKVTAALRPNRDDSYILLTPGPDGLFGTADDVANFPLNK